MARIGTLPMAFGILVASRLTALATMPVLALAKMAGRKVAMAQAIIARRPTIVHRLATIVRLAIMGRVVRHMIQVRPHRPMTVAHHIRRLMTLARPVVHMTAVHRPTTAEGVTNVA
jgi:hypothetical protein